MRIAVIGGGPSGLVAAGSAKGADVTLYEHSEKVGKKIYITGKGRCNFTNLCDAQTFLAQVVRNGNFLRGALSRFGPNDAISLLESNGCATKTERGRRVFPFSDKASDVTKALRAYAEKNGVVTELNADVKAVCREENGFALNINGKIEHFDRVVLCTGGMSYPATGSDGSMYAVVRSFGHNVIEPMPSLVGLVTKEDLSAAEGLTLKNIALSADGVKPIFGDLMITSCGISGPVALTLSSYLSRRVKPFVAYIDFKPALSAEELDARLVRDFAAQKNRQFKNSLDMLLPKSVAPIVIERSGIDGQRQINSVTKEERRRLCAILKHFELTVTDTEGFERAVVTSGGVDVSEVDPKTMESKKIKGLYFGGEILDVDALTGGYNFHIALATGYVAGSNSAVNNG